MKLLQTFFVMFVPIVIPIFAKDNAPNRGSIWSRDAHYLNYVGEERQKAILSPNGVFKVIINDVKIDVMAGGKTLRGMENAGAGTLAELCWSLDSKAFFITESLGGSVGEWRVTVYVISNDSVQSIDVTGFAMAEFAMHYKCIEFEEPNIGAVKWVDSSSSILLVTEVPLHSSCPEMGKIGGYLVSVPSGEIIKQYEESEIRSLCKENLGSRFKIESQIDQIKNLSDTNLVAIENFRIGQQDFVCKVTDFVDSERIWGYEMVIYVSSNDGLVEALKYETIDAFLSFSNVDDKLLVIWEGGSAFHFKVYDVINEQVNLVFDKGSHNLPEIADLDNDGTMELLISEGRFFDNMFPEKTTIFKWSGNEYKSVKEVDWGNRFCE